VVLRDIVKGAELKTKKQQLCKTGDFIVAEIDAKVGGYGFIDASLEDAIVSSHYYLFELDASKIAAGYLAVLCKTDIIQNQINSSGSTNYASIRPADVLGFEIPLPPLDEQERIAAHIERITACSQALTHELTTQKTLLTKLREAILREAVQGKLTHQNPADEDASHLLARIKAEKAAKGIKEKPLPPIKPEEIPYELPQGWMWCRLGEICSNITKGSSPNWQGVKYVENPAKGILFITSKNVDKFKIDLTVTTYVEEKFNEIEPRSILKKGDLLTNIVGASIGRTALYDLDTLANINQAVCILRIEHTLFDKSLLLLLMNSDFITRQMFEMQFAPGRANLSMGDIAKFLIPLPPIVEQQRIVAAVERLLGRVTALEQEVLQQQETLGRLMQSALREVFGGGTEEEQPSTESEKFF
jgi:type I restriction enzyme S subunit